MNEVDLDAPEAPAELRRLFKKRLHGMINVRSDGTNLYAARRVSAGYVWGGIRSHAALPRWQV